MAGLLLQKAAVVLEILEGPGLQMRQAEVISKVPEEGASLEIGRAGKLVLDRLGVEV